MYKPKKYYARDRIKMAEFTRTDHRKLERRGSVSEGVQFSIKKIIYKKVQSFMANKLVGTTLCMEFYTSHC